MTITKALRKLYKVIVGEEAPANANTITKVLLALAEAWTGSGGGSGGSGAEPLIVSGKPVVDKTWKEIHDALASGRTAFLVDNQEYEDGSDPNVYSVLSAYRDTTQFKITVAVAENTGAIVFSTDSMDGYPSSRA